MAEHSPTASQPTRLRKRGGESIALTLREMRKSAGLTLTDLAERSGLAPSTLSKIENGQMSPTYDSLLALAHGLDADIAELVSGQRGQSVIGRKAVTRRGGGIVHSTPQYDYEMLCTDISNKQFVPLLAEVKARSSHSFESLISHPGEEFIYVLRGQIELVTEFYAPTVLEAGDCCYFDSTMGHALINKTDDPATVLWICSRVVPPLVP